MSKKTEINLNIKLTFTGGLTIKERNATIEKFTEAVIFEINNVGIVPDDCEECTATIKVTEPITGNSTEFNFMEF